jgi:hypothetical protein
MSSSLLTGFKRWHGVSEISIQGEKIDLGINSNYLNFVLIFKNSLCLKS